MRALIFWILVAILHWALGRIDLSAPSCAVPCWENTKYISKCLDDKTCLCGETKYQNAVYQCLYAQCDTAHFGAALHHTISQCSGLSSDILVANPPVPDHDSLRRREAEYLAAPELIGSGSAMGFPTLSSPTQGGTYPTQSFAYPTQSVASQYLSSASTSIPPYSPLESAPTDSSAILSKPDYTAVAASVSAGPMLYTGHAPRIELSHAFMVLGATAALYIIF